MLLSVERSGPIASAAAYADDRTLLAYASAKTDARGDAWPLVSGLLSRAGVALADLSEFIAGTGPGSFSGIRAALALLRGMAAPRALPVHGVLSAAATMRAWRRAHPEAPRGRLLGDARRGHIWCFDEPDDYRSLSHTAADITLYALEPPPTTTPPEAAPALPPLADAFAEARSVILADEARLRPLLAARGHADIAEDPTRTPAAPTADARDTAELFFAGAYGPADPVYLHPAVAGAPATAG